MGEVAPAHGVASSRRRAARRRTGAPARAVASRPPRRSRGSCRRAPRAPSTAAPVIASAGVELAAAGERAERGERVALRPREQLVAPVQRRAERPLAGGRVRGPGPSRASASPSRAASPAGSSTPSRAGGELDRQRQAAEAARRCRPPRRGRRRDRGAARPRTVSNRRPRRRRRAARTGIACSAEAERLAARGEDGKPGRALEQAADHRRRRPGGARGCRARPPGRGERAVRARPRRPRRARA